jgi:hypothetical protein
MSNLCHRDWTLDVLVISAERKYYSHGKKLKNDGKLSGFSPKMDFFLGLNISKVGFSNKKFEKLEIYCLK